MQLALVMWLGTSTECFESAHCAGWPWHWAQTAPSHDMCEAAGGWFEPGPWQLSHWMFMSFCMGSVAGSATNWSMVAHWLFIQSMNALVAGSQPAALAMSSKPLTVDSS